MCIYYSGCVWYTTGADAIKGNEYRLQLIYENICCLVVIIIEVAFLSGP